ALTRNFDNMREDEGLADRATFVVDPQGIIQAIEVTAEGIGRDRSEEHTSSLLGLRRRAQIFPLASFIGFVAIDITQHQTDDEEQRRQYRRH
ncbi:hypothetical protein MJM95_27120, partial [Salmonella enterica subsp. enterica serovar Anatum]|nr:hypothetical protein [Salmonella enterica subsp. enterica serovar Anatum]